MVRKRKRKWKLGWIRQLFDGLLKGFGILVGRMADELCRRETTGIVLARSPNS